jgi:AraC-like DNA-binding protein
LTERPTFFVNLNAAIGKCFRRIDRGTGWMGEAAMNADALSELLRAVRLRGAVFYDIEGAPPWAAETPHAREIITEIMPGSEHLIEFHGLVEGTCWASLVGETPQRMQAGDVVLFPQGDPHVLSSAPGMRARGSGKKFFFEELSGPRPFALDQGEAPSTARSADSSVPRAVVICGYLGLDARPFNPLLSALPRMQIVSGGMLGADSWVMVLMRAVVAESTGKRAGGKAVLERMSEMLFVEVLRRHIDSLPETQTGWLAGMRDATVGRALSLMHESPAEPWTLECLSAKAGLSRSSFHERFTHFIGQPPMQYLTQWRMQVASGMLRDSNAKLSEVAGSVGYDSEAAFSRAFKRVAGVSPGAWRRDRQVQPESVSMPDAMAAGA